MSVMVGTRLGPYEVLSLIGAGGMGEVYKARDTRLQRDVAIKVLPAAAASDPERLQLFESEARAVAALSHANVLAVHDVGTQDGLSYFVTELLEGQTLRARLAAGPIPPARAVQLAMQVAKGLAAAHARGIVHRDIKPENLFVTTDGTVKILDFGIARLKEPRPIDADASTVTATVIAGIKGTPGYMAPEQARGEPGDHRVDIFALGCVLYEMLSGMRAFSGTTTADTLAAILTKDPPPLDVDGRSIPMPLQEVVQRCLEKVPGERFSSAHDLALALHALSGPGGAAGTPGPRSWPKRHGVLLTAGTAALVVTAAVLIFTVGRNPVLSFAPRDWVLVADVDNQTGDRVFDKSLTTAFVVSLEQSTHANVFPRSRVAAALKRMGKSDSGALTEPVGREICVREKVRGLISPAISEVGQRYSLTARLIDPATGDTVRSYIRTAARRDDVLTELGSLAADIRRDLGESLASIKVTNKQLPQVTTSSIDALSMYAEGAALWAKGKYDQAMQLYLSALKADPDFAIVHAAVGIAYNSHIYNNPVEGKAHLERAMKLAGRTTEREAQVIEIEYESALGHFDRSTVLYENFLKTYPDDAAMRYNYAGLLRARGRYAEAVAQYVEVLRIAPDSPGALINLATCYSSLERTADALKAYARAFDLEPDWVTSGNLNHEYGFAWVRAGDLAKAEEVFKKGLAGANRPLSTRSLALLDMYRGAYKSAVERLQEAILLNQSAKGVLNEARNQYFLATAQAARGEARRSVAALDKAVGCANQTKGQVWLVTRIGIEFARRRALDRAATLLAKAQAEADLTSPLQASDVHRLQGEIELARGSDVARGTELLLVADRESHVPLTQEAVARAYRLTHDSDKAITAYESLLAMHDDSLGWEAQQYWLEAHYWLASLYAERGQAGKALPLLETMLDRWKDGDPDLPMRSLAERLRAQLTEETQARPLAALRRPSAPPPIR